MIRLQSILVATDFSDPSDAALAYGRELARAFQATLHVVHVVEDIGGRLSGLPNVPESYVDYGRWRREAVEAAEVRLGNLLSQEDRERLRGITRAVLAHAPVRAILEYADEHHIGLIVAGTHGRGVVGRVLMGSVAERLVRFAACPVLTVRHPEHEFVLPDALQRFTGPV
jgi:nucleotide-binding universal stress UspA family protein